MYLNFSSIKQHTVWHTHANKLRLTSLLLISLILAGEGFLSAVTLHDQDRDCPEVVSGHFKTKTQGQQHSLSATSYTDLS